MDDKGGDKDNEIFICEWYDKSKKDDDDDHETGVAKIMRV